MKSLATFALAVLAATPVMAAEQTKAKGEKPAASPGWLIVEEDIWTPLRFEPLASLDAIRYHYRRNEEKAAANEIDKAVSWLTLAAQPRNADHSGEVNHGREGTHECREESTRRKYQVGS